MPLAGIFIMIPHENLINPIAVFFGCTHDEIPKQAGTDVADCGM
jgi:hypothetical protein